MNYRKTVAGVIYQNKEILLVQKPHWNWWDFPQGGVNNGESLEQALTRELKEELGTDKFGNPVNTNIFFKRNFSPETFAHYSDKGFIGKELFYLIIPFFGDRNIIKLGDDLTKRKWCIEEEVYKLMYKEQLDKTKEIVRFMKLNKLI